MLEGARRLDAAVWLVQLDAFAASGGIDGDEVPCFGEEHQAVGHAEVALDEDEVAGSGLFAQVVLEDFGLIVEALQLRVDLGPLGLQSLRQIVNFFYAKGDAGVPNLLKGELV